MDTSLERLSLLLSAEMTPTVPRLQESYSVIVGTFVRTLYNDDKCRCRIDGNNQMYSSPEIAALSEIIIYIVAQTTMKSFIIVEQTMK